MSEHTGIRGKWTWDVENQCLKDFVEVKKEVNAPYVLVDEIPGGIQSMADGLMYTSKRRLRDAYRRLGKEEVGNDKSHLEPVKKEKDPRYEEKLREDIARSYYEVRDGNAPLSEFDKARCEIINRNLKEYNYDNRPRDESGNVLD